MWEPGEERAESIPNWKPSDGFGALLAHLQRLAAEQGRIKPDELIPVKDMPSVPGRARVPGEEG